MYDYAGDMDFYQNQLEKAGITKEMLNMDNYVGLTARELQCVVNRAIYDYKQRMLERD